MKAPVLYCEDDSEIELPWKWQVCAACSGHGKSSAYLGAYTASERDEAGPEFMDAYMRGEFDRPCISCDGTGKHKVADCAAMTPEHRAEYRRQCQEEADFRRIERAERERGA